MPVLAPWVESNYWSTFRLSRRLETMGFSRISP